MKEQEIKIITHDCQIMKNHKQNLLIHIKSKCYKEHSRSEGLYQKRLPNNRKIR